MASGWLPLQGHVVSSLQEWDAYEWSWTGSLTRWAFEHPHDSDCNEVLRTATEHRRAWLDGYRGTLGFVTLLLAPLPPSRAVSWRFACRRRRSGHDMPVPLDLPLPGTLDKGEQAFPSSLPTLLNPSITPGDGADSRPIGPA